MKVYVVSIQNCPVLLGAVSVYTDFRKALLEVIKEIEGNVNDRIQEFIKEDAHFDPRKYLTITRDYAEHYSDESDAFIVTYNDPTPYTLDPEKFENVESGVPFEMKFTYAIQEIEIQ